MIKLMPGVLKTFACLEGTITEKEAVYYPTEFLNSIEVAGLLSYELTIKIIMLVIKMGSLISPRIMNGTECVVI